MNKPASELIALADDLDGWHDCADGDVNAGNGHFRLQCISDSDQQRLNLRAVLREASKALRTAANQSGSERAGVDRAKLAEWADDFEAAAHEVPRGIKSTILMTRAQEVLAALATPPAQPAPASDEGSEFITSEEMDAIEQAAIAGTPLNALPSESTHGKPDGAVREAIQRGDYIECGECSAQGPTDREPKTGWNTRALSTPNAPVEREAAIEAIRAYCQKVSLGSVHSSSTDGDRIYYAGLSIPELADAILAVRLDEAAIRKDEREKQREIDAKIAEHNDRWGEWSKFVVRQQMVPVTAMQIAIAQAIRNGGKQP